MMKYTELDELLNKIKSAPLSVIHNSKEDSYCKMLEAKGYIKEIRGYGSNVRYAITPFGYSFIESGGFAAEESKLKKKDRNELWKFLTPNVLSAITIVVSLFGIIIAAPRIVNFIRRLFGIH